MTTQSNPSYSKLKDIYQNPAYSILSKSKFTQKVRQNYPDIEVKDINDFIGRQELQQIFTKKTFKGYYHIVAPPNTFQIDLFFLENLKKKNKGYGIFLLFVDILSRKMYIKPLKSKTLDDVIDGLKYIINKIGEINAVESDDEFNKEKIKAIFEKKGIKFSSVVSKEEHLSKGNKLGIVDTATRTIKKMINKFITLNDDPQFIDNLDELVEIYNTTPHTSLKNKTPDDVFEDKKLQKMIYNEAVSHNAELHQKVNLDIGDYVRKSLDKGKFDKEKQTFSKTIYVIQDIDGYKYILMDSSGNVDERRFKYSELLKIDLEKIKTFSMVDVLNGKKFEKDKESKVDKEKKIYKKVKKVMRFLKKEGLETTGKIIIRKTRSLRRSERLKSH